MGYEVTKGFAIRQSDEYLISRPPDKRDFATRAAADCGKCCKFIIQTSFMRFLLTMLFAAAVFFPRAQTLLTPPPVGFSPALDLNPVLRANPVPGGNSAPGSTPANTWQLRAFSSINMGYMYFGRGLTYFSVPIGLALYRPLNNHFTAFTAATVAPTVFHFSSLYANPLADPFSGNVTRAGWNAGVSGGLIYTNDAHTFSISGGISVERGSYPVYVPQRTSVTKRY